MMPNRRVFLCAALFLVAPLVFAKGPEDAIQKQMSGLRDVSPAQRPALTVKLAVDIRALPAGKSKVNLADDLSHLATEGDQGADTIQAVADTLSQALAQTPVPAKKDWPPAPYFDLARLVRYEHANSTLTDPLFVKASEALAKNDADVEKIDFTLKDLHGKKVTLSQFRGKVVLVNFWATWCLPCRVEMPGLDAIYTHLESQGLVVLAIDPEDVPSSDAFLIAKTVEPMNFHPTVLLDPGSKVANQFHVDGGIPKSFVFGRDGKLVAVAIDMRTQHQFLTMLAQAGIHQ
ncbi:TlpA disulfide reductase family protein [Telmatobacter sp. DSM 110680]|uniref:TlpA disulfide reductase family protein n=1 Tax=Telmatobacter sp. DSM 110680 TaxID=3036704 RepID=A0AAU7DNS0_9BACT